MKLQEYDTFELLEDLNFNIIKGMQGVILEVWVEGKVFEVEFVKVDGTNFEFEGKFTFTVESSQICKVSV